MAINVFISDNAPVMKEDEKAVAVPPTYRIDDPVGDDDPSYTVDLPFQFTAPGNDPTKYALQVISYRSESGTLVYTFRGERTGAQLTPSDDPVLTAPYDHYTFTGVTTSSIGSDPYVLLILAKVEPGNKRRVRAVRQLTA